MFMLCAPVPCPEELTPVNGWDPLRANNPVFFRLSKNKHSLQCLIEPTASLNENQTYAKQISEE